MSNVTPISRDVENHLARADVTQRCPFCGEHDTLEVNDEDGFDENDVYDTCYWVACSRCGCEGPKADSAALATAAWNHRTTQEQRPPARGAAAFS